MEHITEGLYGLRREDIAAYLGSRASADPDRISSARRALLEYNPRGAYSFGRDFGDQILVHESIRMIRKTA